VQLFVEFFENKKTKFNLLKRIIIRIYIIDCHLKYKFIIIYLIDIFLYFHNEYINL